MTGTYYSNTLSVGLLAIDLRPKVWLEQMVAFTLAFAIAVIAAEILWFL